MTFSLSENVSRWRTVVLCGTAYAAQVGIQPHRRSLREPLPRTARRNGEKNSGEEDDHCPDEATHWPRCQGKHWLQKNVHCLRGEAYVDALAWRWRRGVEHRSRTGVPQDVPSKLEGSLS